LYFESIWFGFWLHGFANNSVKLVTYITSYSKGQITIGFAPASLILTNYFLPLIEALYAMKYFAPFVLLLRKKNGTGTLFLLKSNDLLNLVIYILKVIMQH